jgi:N-acetylglutamate synthase-like GNAT family acetyltransferase
MTDKNHFHLLMQQGVATVAVAQVEMLDNETAVIRSLATDAAYQRQGIGSKLLATL